MIGNTNQVYFYKVVATNTVGDTETLGFPTITTQSLDSNIITVGTPASNAPAAPTNLTGVIQAGPKNLLSWTDNATNETGFTIERATNSAFTVGLTTTTVGPNITTAAQTGLYRGITYYFRVRAYNGGGSSTWSNVFSVVTP